MEIIILTFALANIIFGIPKVQVTSDDFPGILMNLYPLTAKQHFQQIV